MRTTLNEANRWTSAGIQRAARGTEVGEAASAATPKCRDRMPYWSLPPNEPTAFVAPTVN